jgi:serine protease Do
LTGQRTGKPLQHTNHSGDKVMFPQRSIPVASCAKLTLGGVALALSLSACGKTDRADLKPEQIVEQNKAATVLIKVNNKVEYSYPRPVFSSDRQKVLIEKLSTQVANGDIKSQADAFEQYLREVLSNPGQYATPGKKISGEAKIQTTGTGFIVTQNGTILTAAHVVSGKDKAIKRQLGTTALREITDNYCNEQRQSITPDQQKLLQDRLSVSEFMKLCRKGFAGYYAQNLEFDKIQTTAAVLLQPTNPRQEREAKSIPAEIKKTGETLPGEDVAVLQIPGTNLPTVMLEENPVVTGNPVVSIGYPGFIGRLDESKSNRSSSAESDEKQANKIPESTFTDGKVSAAERSVDGGKVIHANVDINPGNSGGPLFSIKGAVVGIASFISVDEDGKKVGNASYFVPISVAKQQLQGLGISAEPGNLTKRYQAAIDRFDQKDFNKALSLFKEVRDTNPEFPYIQQQITKTQEEVDRMPKGLPLWLMGVLGVGLAGTGAWWIQRQFKQRVITTVAERPAESMASSDR